MMRLADLSADRRDLLIVVGSIVTGTLLYVADLYPLYVSGSGDGAPIGMRVGLFIAICATELLRRKAPVVALALGAVIVAADTVHGPSIPVLLVFADLLYAATLYGPPRLHRDMVPIAAAGLLVVVLASFLMQQDWREPLMGSVTALPFIVIPIWWATNVRQHRNIAEVERANARQLAKIAQLDRSAAIAAERARMARDLHDIIAGHLSSIAIQSAAVLSMTADDPATVRRVLSSVRQNSVQALDEMGSMIRLLRADGTGADETEAPTRLSDLPQMVESVRASGMEIEVDCRLDTGAPLPAAVDLTAYRITQEALTNVLKHAPRAKARVDIRHETGKLIVEVTNDLPGHMPAGAPVPEIGHNGLLNMQERATVVGGTFSAGPQGASWLVRAVLPATVSES